MSSPQKESFELVWVPRIATCLVEKEDLPQNRSPTECVSAEASALCNDAARRIAMFVPGQQSGEGSY